VNENKSIKHKFHSYFVQQFLDTEHELGEVKTKRSWREEETKSKQNYSLFSVTYSSL